MENKDELMVILKPEFKKKLFSLFLKRYRFKNIFKFLSKSHGMIYHYRNNRGKYVPLSLVKKVCELCNISKKEFEINIIKIISREEMRNKYLDLGRDYRRKYLQENLIIKIPSIDFLQKDNRGHYINIKDWLFENKWIDKIKNQGGIIRNVKGIIKGEQIIISYECYNKSKKGFSIYNNFLPIKLYLNIDFLYFLGLIYGDGTSGSRVGLVNKNTDLIEWTRDYLDKYFSSEINCDLYVYKKGVKSETINKWKDLKKDFCRGNIYYNNKAVGDYVFTIYIVNKFLRRMLGGLFENLEGLFKVLDFEQKGSFLAGFFDAEGNVNKLDRTFRWSQETIEKRKNLIDILKQEGYHLRCDKKNIVIGYKQEFKNDLQLFSKQILPFVKHSKKKQEAVELLDGYLVRDCYKELVRMIKKNPGIDNLGISRIIKRKKNQRQLSALFDAGFLDRTRKRVDESFKYFITEKGTNWINGGD